MAVPCVLLVQFLHVMSLSGGPAGGCAQTDLRGTGGDGLLYCFAAN